MRVLIIALLLSMITSGAVFGASQYDDLINYMPVNIGNSWVYKGSLAGDAGARSVITEVKGHQFLVKTEASIGLKDLYERRGNKLLLTMRQSFLSPQPQKLEYPVVELVSPLKTNTKWEFATSNSSKTACSVKIIDKFTVKAGEFQSVARRVCLKYDKKGSKWQKNDGHGHITYYAPNVGMIKMESEEQDGNAWYELTEFEIK